jgi:hypothetical protein
MSQSDEDIVEYFKHQKMINFIEDVECMISCGNCCWGCAFLTLNGCSLERHERPPECNMYLCSEGTEKLYEDYE